MKYEYSRIRLFVLSVLLLSGCGSQPLIQVETVVRGDGSCERTIWQPEGEMLPPEATKAEWRSRWNRVKPTEVPPAFAKERPRDNARKYFTATGTFRTPSEIPAHFLNRVEVGRASAVGRLDRSYERLDHVFVIEHRWRETLTNVVSREGFAKARDELRDALLTFIADGLSTAYAAHYDVDALNRYVREEGGRFLDQATDIWFDHAAAHRPEEELSVRLASLARDFGLDLLDASGNIVEGKEREERISSYLRHRLVLGMRRKDGSRLSEEELRAVIDPDSDTSLARARERYWQEHRQEFEDRLSRPFLGMFGLYGHPLGISGSGNPALSCSITLPGEIVESNGTIAGVATTRWCFSGDRSFPGGYTMEARSLEIDRASQERILGRIAIKDRDQALALVRELDSSETIREAMGKLRASGSRRPLDDLRLSDAAERERLTRVRRILGTEK